MTINPFVRTAAMCVSLALFAGCGGDSSPVEKRAIDRWNFLIAHQGDKAYDYLSPGTRETQTRETYAASMNNRPIKWTSATFNHKECDADRCKVLIDVTYSIAMPGAGPIGKPITTTSTQAETWVHVNGTWYFLPK